MPFFTLSRAASCDALVSRSAWELCFFGAGALLCPTDLFLMTSNLTEMLLRLLEGPPVCWGVVADPLPRL